MLCSPPPPVGENKANHRHSKLRITLDKEGAWMAARVMVAMSGGVDSSVAAALLRDQGFDVAGVTLKLFSNEDICVSKESRTCCALSDVEDARWVAFRLNIPHHVFNMRQQFNETVIARFISEYEQGRTPNPCIDCNRFIKFEELLRRASMLEYPLIATGHYARREKDSGGRYLLRRPADRSKDQTYVLYSLTQNQLSHTLFPLGELTKEQVRERAAAYGFINAKKPDSQDICFVPDGDYAAFIENHTGKKLSAGNFVDTSGNVLGRHNGIEAYTIGQRKGLGLSLGKPMYVSEKSVHDNTVTIAEESALYSRRLVADDVNLIAVEHLTGPIRVTAKTRYSQKEDEAVLHPLDNGRCLIEFDRPQRAVTPGQAVVFYDGEYVFGGGTIQKIGEDL